MAHDRWVVYTCLLMQPETTQLSVKSNQTTPHHTQSQESKLIVFLSVNCFSFM